MRWLILSLRGRLIIQHLSLDNDLTEGHQLKALVQSDLLYFLYINRAVGCEDQSAHMNRRSWTFTALTRNIDFVPSIWIIKK